MPDAMAGGRSAALRLHWATEDATRAFAGRLAALPGIGQAYIELHGDLGAGKTTLARHLLRALGVAGRIKSPTYAVMEPYQLGALRVSHFDFYRFGDPREWEDAGFRDVFASPGLKLAEWPEKAAGVLPPADLRIHLAVQPPAGAAPAGPAEDTAGEDTPRAVLVQAGTPLGLSMLEALRG